MRIGYADNNGQPYASLGKMMGDEGLMPKDQVNFFTIRRWLYQHPDGAFELMERNPSYVFFRRSTRPARSARRSAADAKAFAGGRWQLYSLRVADVFGNRAACQAAAHARPVPAAGGRAGYRRRHTGPVRGDIFSGRATRPNISPAI